MGPIQQWNDLMGKFAIRLFLKRRQSEGTDLFNWSLGLKNKSAPFIPVRLEVWNIPRNGAFTQPVWVANEEN